MAERDQQRPQLTVISGGRSRHVQCGVLTLVAGPAGREPFAVDGIVFEEDTFLVMSSESTEFGGDEHVIRIMTDALDALPAAPGSVLVKGRNPVRLLAVIHDFDKHPSCREEWVRAATRSALLLADEYRLKAIAMPIPGTVHKSLESGRALELLAEAIKGLSPARLQRIWLLVPEAERMQVLDRLEELIG